MATKEPTPATPAEPTPVEGNPELNATPDPTAVEAAQKAERVNFAQQRYELGQFQQESRPAVAPQSAPLPPLNNETDKFLFGETLRPSESITTGTNRRGSGLAPPQEVVRYLDVVNRLAGRPDAPPQVQQLAAALARELG